MAFEVFITLLLALVTIILTALGLMLAILGIGLAALALWGFTGLRDELSKTATKNMAEAMDAKLKEYPASTEILALFNKMEGYAEFYEQTQSQLVTPPEPNTIDLASKVGIKVEAEVVPLVSDSPIEIYPGEEAKNENSNLDGPSDPPETGPDSGTDTR